MNNRWDELTPELQVALTRLINHLASTQDQDRADIVDEFRELLWESFVGECSDDGESGQSVKLVPLA